MDIRGMKGLILLLGIPVVMLVRGFVLSTIWNWFAVPIGAPAISVATAMGLALCVALAVGPGKTDIPDTSLDVMERIVAKGIIAPLFVLTFAWIVTFFM